MHHLSCWTTPSSRAVNYFSNSGDSGMQWLKQWETKTSHKAAKTDSQAEIQQYFSATDRRRSGSKLANQSTQTTHIIMIGAGSNPETQRPSGCQHWRDGSLSTGQCGATPYEGSGPEDIAGEKRPTVKCFKPYIRRYR